MVRISFERIILKGHTCGICITNNAGDAPFLGRASYTRFQLSEKNLCSIIHNGATTLFWKDNWFEGCAPADNWPLLFQLAQNKEEFIREITNRLSMISLEDFLVVSILANIVNAQSSL